MIHRLLQWFRSSPKTRLYVVVRADIAPGLQAAQLVHAATVLCLDQTGAARAWQKGSQNVVCLSVANETDLARYASETANTGRQVAIFREPDLDDQLTAFAVLGEGLFPGLPLALRPVCQGCGKIERKCDCDRYVLNGSRPRAA